MIEPINLDFTFDRVYECRVCVTRIELYTNNVHIPKCGNPWCKDYGRKLLEVDASCVRDKDKEDPVFSVRMV